MKNFSRSPWIFAVFFISNVALAQVPLSKNGSDGLNLDPQVAAKVATAVHVMRLSEEAHCSAVAINKRGDFLTALHCVRPCLIEEGALETSSNAYIGLLDLAVVTQKWPQVVHCSKIKIESVGITGVDVIATGPALSSYSATFITSFASLFDELAAAGFQLRANDFAIVRARSAKVSSCLEFKSNSTASSNVARNIWAIGYLLPKTPPLIPILHASEGQPYANAEESVYYSSRQNDDDRLLVRTLYSAPGILYSNASVFHGQSGGPVIDAQGSIVGVTSGFTSAKSGSKIIRELVAPTMNFAFSHMPLALSSELLVANRECR